MLSDSAGRFSKSLGAAFCSLFFYMHPTELKVNPHRGIWQSLSFASWQAFLVPSPFSLYPHTGSFASRLHPHSHPHTLACWRHRHLSTRVELSLGRWNSLQQAVGSGLIPRIVWMNVLNINRIRKDTIRRILIFTSLLIKHCNSQSCVILISHSYICSWLQFSC